MRIMLEKVADSARKAVKMAEPYKPYGGQFLEFCSISLSTYQTCMNLTRKSTEFCQLFSRHYPHMPTLDATRRRCVVSRFLSGSRKSWFLFCFANLPPPLRSGIRKLKRCASALVEVEYGLRRRCRWSPGRRLG